MTTNKNRITKLEKQAAAINSESPIKSWKDLIDWLRGVLTFDADTEARLKKQFAELLSKAESARLKG